MAAFKDEPNAYYRPGELQGTHIPSLLLAGPTRSWVTLL